VYALTIASSPERSPAHAALLFEKCGQDYFLARVIPQNGDEREIVLTPAIMERELRRGCAEPVTIT